MNETQNREQERRCTDERMNEQSDQEPSPEGGGCNGRQVPDQRATGRRTKQNQQGNETIGRK